MKRFFILFALLGAFTVSLNAQELRKPSEGKALIYLMRTSTAAPLVKFSFFHEEQYLGKFNGGKFMVYEVDPGQHIFWVRSENSVFLEANVQAGGVYIVDATVKMGAFKAGVGIQVLEKSAKKYDKLLKRVNKVLSKNKEQFFSDAERQAETTRMADMITRVRAKYEEKKAAGKVVEMSADMYHVINQ